MDSPKRKESGFLGNAAFLLVLLSQTVVCAMAGEYFFPQFAQGETSTGFYVTELVLQNPTNTAEEVDIFFRDDNGKDLSIDLTDGRSGSQFQVPLAPGASTLLTSIGTGPLKVGWVHIIARTWIGSLRFDGVLTGVLTFRYYENNILKTEVAVHPSTNATPVMIPVDYSDTSNTGVAIAGIDNVMEVSGPGPDYCCARLNLALILLDQNGSIVATKKIFDLVGYSHIARFVNEFFPDLPSPFKGTLIITAGGPSESAPPEIVFWPRRAAVLGLKLKDGLMSSIPAISQHYLPAFTRIAEVEGNDTVASAQRIPLIPFTLEAGFNGATQFLSDYDYFSLDLEKDDLLVGLLQWSDYPYPEYPGLTIGSIFLYGPDKPRGHHRTIVYRVPASGRHTLLFQSRQGTYRFTAIRIR